MEEFLKKGNLSNSGFWDDQIGFFLLTLLFLVVQWFVSPALMVICASIELLLLIFCKKRETMLYANVTNGCMHMGILMLLWWIDGWCAISLIVNGSILWILIAVGTITYTFYILWRVNLVKKRIAQNWYAQLSASRVKIGPVIVFSIAFLGMIRLIFRNMSLGNVTAFFILGCTCFILDMLMIFTVDLAMRTYYFSKLTEEEQQYIVKSKPMK